MSYQEKRVSISLLGMLAVFAVYAVCMAGYYQDGRLAGPDAGALIGRSVFILMGAGIAAVIVLQIVFAIVNAMVTREEEKPVSDERDRLIDLKAMQVGYMVFSLGFVAAMGLLALGMAALQTALLIIVGAMFFASVIGDVVKLMLYRYGV